MSTTELLEILQPLETELHQWQTRQNSSRLEELLHPDFEEFGRSGRKYSRLDVVAEFVEITDYPEVVAQNFKVHSLAEHVALLTYTSAHVSPSGELHRYTLRTSLWMRSAQGWQMRFHQGTPSDAL